jgi:hypothetical protein
MLPLWCSGCQPLKPSYTLVKAPLILSTQPLFSWFQLTVNTPTPPISAAEHPPPPRLPCALPTRAPFLGASGWSPALLSLQPNPRLLGGRQPLVLGAFFSFLVTLAHPSRSFLVRGGSQSRKRSGASYHGDGYRIARNSLISSLRRGCVSRSMRLPSARPSEVWGYPRSLKSSI